MYAGYKIKDGEHLIAEHEIVVDKNCGCCAKHWAMVPYYAVFNEIGAFWECQCKSTLFVKAKAIHEVIKDYGGVQ